MTGLRPYSEYKNTEIPWLDEIPSEWNVLPLMACVNESRRTNQGMSEQNLLSLSYGRIITKDIETNDGLLPESFDTYQIVQPDDVVFRLTDLQNDKRSLRSALVTERGIITSAYLAVTPQMIDARFFAYAMRDTDTRKVFYAMGGGLRQSMKYSDMKHLPVVVPTQNEQAAIAAFLDRETAEIDAFIADQEELITLLAERRAATISRAVTKGLDRTVPMKMSATGWFEELPASWQEHSLKYGLLYLTSGSRGWADFYSDEGDAFIRIGNLGRMALEINLSDLQHVSLPNGVEGQRARTRVGDVLFSITAFLGSVGVVDQAAAGAYVSQHVALSRPDTRVFDPKYLGYLALSDGVQSQLEGGAYGGTKLQLSLGDIAGLAVVRPSLEEQRAIVNFLDSAIGEFNALIADAGQAVALSRERRAALISAAVTGEIDVREQGTAA